MQINLDTNRSYNQNFGNAIVTKKAVTHLKTRFMTPADMDRFEKVIERFNKKGKFIEGLLDEINGDLTASIFSSGRYSEDMTEGTLSRLFRSPIHFIEKWADRADEVEARLKNDVRLEELVKKAEK